MKMLNSKAYLYCKSSVKKKTTPKYVKKQMREWMRICEGKDPTFMVSQKKIKQIEMILKILIMPKGLKAGQTLYECSTGYQWLIYMAVLGTVYRDNPQKRKYETCVLEICRKNFKTFTIAVLFILLFLTEPKFSKFYSVAPDGTLSREIREAMSEIIRSSPAIYEFKGNKRFRILRDYIEFKPTQIKYTPLAYSTSRMDGRLPSVFCAERFPLRSWEITPTRWPLTARAGACCSCLCGDIFLVTMRRLWWRRHLTIRRQTWKTPPILCSVTTVRVLW